MSEMTVTAILRLVDQVSGPAREAENELQKLKRATDVLSDIQKGPMRSPHWEDGLKTIAERRAQLEKLQTVEKEASGAVEAAERIKANSATAAAADIAAANERIVASEQRTVGAVERSAKEQASAVQTLEKQRSAAHAQMAKAEHDAREARASALRGGAAQNFLLGAAAGAVSVHMVVGAGRSALAAGAERQQIEIKAANAGISATDIGRIHSSALEAKRGAPNMSVSEIEEMAVEARSAIKHPEELFGLMGPLARAGSVMRGMGVDNSGLSLIVKAAESLGRMNSPEQFKAYLDGQIKAMQVFGKTINPEQVYEAAKYSKSAGATLSDAFINGTMPSLIQEMRGMSAGNALFMLSRTLRGGMDHRGTATELLNDVGLTPDTSQIHHNKAGKVTGYGGKIKGDDLLATDPDQWVWKVLKPALEAKGITDLKDQISFINKALPGNAANVVRILLQQQESIEQHQKNLAAAADAEQAAANQAQSATAALTALTKSLNDLGAAASGPAMTSIAGLLNTATGAIEALAGWGDRHPRAAVAGGAAAIGGGLFGSGYILYKLSTGFGLSTSAVALDQSAAALTAAAGRLGAASGLPVPGSGPSPKLNGPGLLRTLWSGLNLFSAVQNMPQTPEDWKKQAESNDALQAGVDAWMKDHLPKWFFPDKSYTQQAIDTLNKRPDDPPGLPSGFGKKMKDMADGLDHAKTKTKEVHAELQSLNTTVSPQFDMAALDAYLDKARQLSALLGGISSLHGPIHHSFAPSTGALHDGPEAR